MGTIEIISSTEREGGVRGGGGGMDGARERERERGEGGGGR